MSMAVPAACTNLMTCGGCKPWWHRPTPMALPVLRMVRKPATIHYSVLIGPLRVENFSCLVYAVFGLIFLVQCWLSNGLLQTMLSTRVWMDCETSEKAKASFDMSMQRAKVANLRDYWLHTVWLAPCGQSTLTVLTNVFEKRCYRYGPVMSQRRKNDCWKLRLIGWSLLHKGRLVNHGVPYMLTKDHCFLLVGYTQKKERQANRLGQQDSRCLKVPIDERSLATILNGPSSAVSNHRTFFQGWDFRQKNL